MVDSKSHRLNMAKQAKRINLLFPNSELRFDKNKLTWKHNLSPTPLSEIYEVKLTFERGKHPSVYVINQKLSLYPGKVSLPHVYSTDKQHLCLYNKKHREWTSDKYLAETIIPWTSEWLFHYEIWLITGKWHGGGIHHD
ncbi:MAG: hypothetical protein R2797_13710 [Gelidibacter sp.]|nr:hypothetical protein [Saprospiraceae bacterium]